MGVQFRPEFHATAVRACLDDDEQLLRAEAHYSDRISEHIEETSCGNEIPKRFARLAKGVL